MDDDLEGRIFLNGSNGTLFMRAKKKTGQILGDVVIHLDGNTGDLLLGGAAANGGLLICPAGTNQSAETATFNYNAATKLLLLKGAKNQPSVRVDGAQSNLWIGGNDFDGDIVIYPRTVPNDAPTQMSAIHLSGDGSQISIRSGGVETIKLDGAIGDIILHNADGAEEFDVDDESVEPGSVLVIEAETRLRIADRPYDRRVAGIVSGGGGTRPGIVLGRNREGNRVPVALFGKVGCKVDAVYGAIAAGDLLTTSATPGHAMRAEPGECAHGTVIGKAMSAHNAGRGLIPVLVGLQ
jgi:hypothetical protein